MSDYYIIAHLARDPAVTYGSDTSDLYLQVFDQDINHLQSPS